MGAGEANLAGNVHGGVIMYLCDEVAGIAAVRHCGARVVTVAMDRMTFLHPVYIGHLVTVKATVNAAWRSSMEVGVRVEAENIRSGEVTHTSTAYVTMVALDEEGRATAVPPVEPQTPDEPTQPEIAFLATLPPRQRAVIALRFFLDLSEAQTASIMGCSVGTVKSQQHKALAKLSVILSG